MRTPVLVLVCLLLLLGPAAADEKKVKRKPAKPLTTEQAADAVLAAVKAKDNAALEALAEQAAPDPWLVADLLCYRGEHDAAEAFAKGAPRKTVEKLPGYVASRRGTESDEDARRALAAMNTALQQKQWAQVALLAEGVTGPLDSVVRIRVAYGRGHVLRQLRRLRESSRLLVEVGEAARRIGWLARASAAFHQGFLSAWFEGDLAGAASAMSSRLAVCREIGHKRHIAQALGNLGLVQYSLGNYAEALRYHTESLVPFREIGNKKGIATTLVNVGLVRDNLGDYAAALRAYDESLTTFREIGNAGGVAAALMYMGNVHMRLAAYSEALRHLDTALEGFRKLGDKLSVSDALTNIGNVLMNLGNYPEALRSYDEALTVKRQIGDKPGLAGVLMSLGNAHQSLGNYREALRHYSDSLATFREMGEKAAIASTLGNIGIMQDFLGKDAEALRAYEESLETFREIGHKSGVAKMLGGIGGVHRSRGNHAEALRLFKESLVAFRAIDRKQDTAEALSLVGSAQVSLGKYSEALECYEESLSIQRAIGHKQGLATTLWNLASLHLRLHKDGEAVAFARKGIELVAGLAEGLAEGEGAGTREAFSGLFATGGRAALRAGKVDDLLWFLEQGRAGSLRESLGSRAALENAVLPPKLLKALNEARTHERQALATYRKAMGGGAEAAEAAREAWERSGAEVAQVTAQIQRESKVAAAVVLPEPDSLDQIRGYLSPGEALVMYGFSSKEAMALIVRADGARMLPLGPSKPIENDIVQVLHLGQRSGARGLELSTETSEVDLAATLDSLRTQLVDPLQLGKDVTRVIVSPSGALAYVPFALLMPSQKVAYVPSGTTYGLLRKERSKHGAKILGVGNPDYQTVVNATAINLHGRAAATGRLSPLPGTLEEVEAIGGVPLLGAAATEQGVRAAIEKRARWRSVHFACHGLVDPERPMFSSLALTATATDDGFLTALEILGMKIPADLVVLSACETGKGRIYRTEGIRGLTRAFMFAGAPRVICSLWKVPDKATATLMTRFYELWNPKDGSKGLGAAAALKKAQEFVKGHDKWKHPYYWAAWVLWGLPD